MLFQEAFIDDAEELSTKVGFNIGIERRIVPCNICKILKQKKNMLLKSSHFLMRLIALCKLNSDSPSFSYVFLNPLA